MHHPHIPDDIKHFGKHLFATFLGLLMALGLEQWREHHLEAKRAEQALAAVEAELREDLGMIDRQITRSESSVRTLEALETYVDDLIAAKRHGQTLPALPQLGATGVAPNFYSDAWETLKGLGVLHHLDPTRARSLARAYLGMAGFRQHFDAQPILRQIPATLFLQLEKPRSLAELDLPSLEQSREGIRLMRIFFQWCQHEMAYVRATCESALKS